MPAYNPGSGFKPRSRKFGRQKHPITGVLTGHAGDDWPAPAGTPIPAAYDGKVRTVAYQYNQERRTGWGWYVLLEHSINGKVVLTRYAHMREKPPLAVGASVKKGEAIGPVGSTGGSTGPHLHFEVIVDGVPVNPDDFDFSDSAPGTSAATQVSAGAWAFPFGANAKQSAVTAADYLGAPGGRQGALSRADDGFYPIGANGLWHGGIHFDAGTGTLLDQFSGVRCINHGEVVAYRVNKRYPTVEFPGGNHAAYSTGFVLIRHKLERPEQSSPGKRSQLPREGATGPKVGANAESLTFYSLYMHLLDWEGYQKNPKATQPAFWSEPRVFRVGVKATDQQEELVVERMDIPVEAMPIDIADIDFSGACAGHDDDDLCSLDKALAGEYP